MNELSMRAWDSIAREAQAEGRGSWDLLSEAEQKQIIADWTEREGRIEMLDSCRKDILGMVVDVYDPGQETWTVEQRRQEFIDIGMAVCATMAVLARKATAALWKRSAP